MGTAQNDSAFLTILIVGGVVAVVCAVISGEIAKSKNQDFTSYLCLGLFLGPIGLIAAAAAPKRAPLAPRGMVSHTCPRCNAHQNIPATSSEFECWQCKTATKVKPLLAIAPGWYPEPGQGGEERYWDGQNWTSETRPA
ncbi:DUF2510 domain-containing protein [Mycobacterium kansasii]